MLGKILFLLQVLAMLACALPLSLHVPGSITLVVAALAALLGGWVLWFNKLGNWSVLPKPLANAQLIRTGPYAWMRHPMYTTVLLACFVFVLHNLNLINLVAWCALLLVLNVKARYEERLLKKAMDEYADYMQSVTSRFLPKRSRKH
jgi:protein-S-isoprenylcysteine O-methyltransferase Ste14